MKTEEKPLDRIIRMTFDAMPDEFYSSQYWRTFRSLGGTDHNSNTVVKFLHKNASNVKSRKIWEKCVPVTRTTIYHTKFGDIHHDPTKVLIPDIDFCIKTLKDAGYKVMKPVTDWQEL